MFRAVQHQGDDITGFHPVVGLYRTAVYEDASGICRCLYAVSRSIVDEVDDEFVYAQQLLPFVGYQPPVFVEPFGAFVIVIDFCIRCFRELFQGIVHSDIGVRSKGSFFFEDFGFAFQCPCQ